MEELARLIISAAECHEQSWEPEKKKYGLSINQCIERYTAHDQHERRLASMLLHVCWNDAQSWAEEVLK